MPSFVGGGSSEVSLLLPPAAFPGVASASLPLLLAPDVLIEPARIFRPLYVQPQPAEIEILQRIFSFLCTSLALKLHEGISFLCGSMYTLRSILQLPYDLKESSNYCMVTRLDTLPMNRLMFDIIFIREKGYHHSIYLGTIQNSACIT